MPHPLNNSEEYQDSKTILFKGSKLEDQHTRSIRWNLSWVYKPDDHLQWSEMAIHLVKLYSP